MTHISLKDGPGGARRPPAGAEESPRPRRIGRWIALGLVALVVLTIGYYWYRIFGYQPPPLPPPTPRQIAASQQKIGQLKAMAKELRTRGAGPQQFSVRVTDEDANIYLATDPEAAPLRERLPGLRVHFGPDGLVTFGAWVDALGRKAWATVDGRVQATGNTVNLDVESVRLGQVTAPDFVRRRVVEAVQGEWQRAQSQLPVSQVQIQTTDGNLAASGVGR